MSEEIKKEENITEQPKKAKKCKGKVFTAITAALVALCLVVSGVSLVLTKSTYDIINKNFSSAVDTGEEDDIVIMDTYTIKSTLNISDAYISGDTKKLSDREKETLDMAKKVIEEITTDDMSDFEKEEAVYKYLTVEIDNDSSILTVIPVTDEDSDNPYGVLKYHNAVCVGYATTFRMFMQMMGIECKVIHSADLIHSWNLVKLDGEWYHTDCYMDSDEGNYRNFNMNDSTAAQTHEWNHQYFPAATGVKFNYATINCSEITDIYALPEFVKENLDEHNCAFSCTFKKNITADTEKIASTMADAISESICNSENYSDTYVDFTWSLTEDGKYRLSTFVDYPSEESEELDDAIMEKIYEAISEAFGESYEEDWEEEWEN